MQEKEKIIAYDLGTGGIKASLFDVAGKSYAHTFRAYDTRYEEGDIHEQRPDDWWEGIVETTKLLLGNTGVSGQEIVGVAISGHSLGVVPIDRDGNLLREYTPIWSDKRAKKEAEAFFKSIPYEQWYMTTGNGFPAECYSLFKIMWYRDHEPDMYERTYKILGSKDYCNFRMTGRCCTDYSYASGCGAYSLKKHEYVSAYIQAAAVKESLFPEILYSHDIVGTMLPEAAAELGLSTETKVICGGVDNSCMSLGARATQDGRTYVSLGSSSWIAVASEEPILDAKQRPYVFEHCIPGYYISSTSIFSAGNSFRWVRDVICPDLVEKEKSGEIKDAYDAMNEMIVQSPIGAKHLLFNPSLAGGSMIEDSPDICGAYAGLNLGHTRNDLVRAAMEGITFNLCYAMNILKKYHTDIPELLLVGGGSKSRIWRQMFADIFNMKIIKTVIDQDAASLGAAALVAYGLGYWNSYDCMDQLHVIESVEEPNAENVAQYSKMYEIHRKLAHDMSDVGSTLTKL